MNNYLLLILILIIIAETSNVSGQLITISGAGRKITGLIQPGKGMTSVSNAKDQGDSVQYPDLKNNSNFSLQTGLKQVMYGHLFGPLEYYRRIKN